MTRQQTHKCIYCKKIIKERMDIEQYSKYSPFCSSRCKSLDLGKWLNGDYVIEGDLSNLTEEELLALKDAIDK